MNHNDLTVRAEPSQGSSEQLSPVYEDSAIDHFGSGMQHRDDFNHVDRVPSGIDPYYQQPASQELPRHYSSSSSFSSAQANGNGAPQHQAHYDSQPEQAPVQPIPQRPATRQRSARAGALSMLRVPPKIADKYVNLLVVGESGLGKTTFIRNCFADLLNDEFELLDASWGSMREFKESPSVYCTHLPAIEVPEALIRLHYSVQDVPGYGDDLAYENSDAYVAEILALVRQQNIHQCSATQGILLEELEFKHMYDACIYFISPHQLKPRDLKFMSSISKVVPVIPVIAKADCMTPEERQKFRDHINKSLNSPAVLGEGEPEPIEIFKFPVEVMDAAEAEGRPLPFAVIGSREVDEVEGDVEPLRHYPWGTCLPLRKEHSDAVFFRKTVLEYGFHALREEKKNRYVSFRDSLIQSEKQQEQSQAEKVQQQQQQEQARLAEEQLYFAQQQAELASANKSGSRSTSASRSFNSSAGGGMPDYSSGLNPATPGKKPYDDSKTKTNFFGIKKKNSHELGY